MAFIVTTVRDARCHPFVTRYPKASDMSPDKPLQSDEQGSKHLDMIRPGEIGHVHFQDVRDIPREF
ncbi:MAG: hypothetical protein J2P53_17375, partial [Bradyrhizobiaceae bacterium]|nr:hypothetical protein [Bradyrhizobiaceae bacterium]